MRRYHRILAIAMCGMLAMQQSVLAAKPGHKLVNGVKVYTDVQNLQLDPAGSLRGALVDVNGRPVADADVVVGQKGKVVATLKTNREGMYQCTDLDQGIYQVATFAGVRSYRVFENANAPSDAVRGSIMILSPSDMARAKSMQESGVARGQAGGANLLAALVTNPLVWGLIIAAAIAIPIATNDDDAS